LEDGDESSSTEKLIETIKRLADEFILSKLSYDLYFPIIYQGQQFYSYHFGKRCFELLKDDRNAINQFVTGSIDSLASIPSENRNVNVLIGFLSDADNGIKEATYNLLLQNLNLNCLVFKLIASEKNGKDYFPILFNLIENSKCEITNFNDLIHGEAIFNLEQFELENLCEQLFTYGIDGYTIVFNMLFRLEYNNDKLKAIVNPIIKKCVYYLGFKNSTKIEEFKWSHTINSLLEDSTDNDFAIFINRSIIDSISLQKTYHLNYEVQRIYSILLKNHFKAIWPDLSESLIATDQDYVKFRGLKHILGSHIGGFGSKVGVLFMGDIDEIFKWCENNPTTAPHRLAELTPIFANNNDDYNHWHPIAERLINDFGDKNEVLQSISANMGSYSWTGSVVYLLESKKKLLQSLINHNKQTVSEWAYKNINYLESEIRREKNIDEEYH
jgi:hypothetical protein